MTIPGYDEWKLMTPEEERPDDLCPICGASFSDLCLEEELTGSCPWEESEPDPDYLRDFKMEEW